MYINIAPLITVLFLIVLEAMLSLDNALVLAVQVRWLPKHEQKKALMYGVWGAMGFRALALGMLTWCMRIPYIALVGGIYLMYVGVSNLLVKDKSSEHRCKGSFAFWRTVLMVELMDVAFSADSILASLSVSKSYTILLTGGIMGILTMRLAAGMFIRLLNWFPQLEQFAYGIVVLLGIKMVICG